MSAYELSDTIVEKLAEDKYDFFVLNYANADMVGHTGQMDSAVQAIEALDRCLHQVVEAFMQKGGIILITADHGNAEEMVNQQTGKPQTAHSDNIVPVILVGDGLENVSLHNGSLKRCV